MLSSCIFLAFFDLFWSFRPFLPFGLFLVFFDLFGKFFFLFTFQMMQHAWDGYAKYAWGKNEVRPVSLRGHTASIFGQASMGATIVDSLDTLYIMGMTDEYEKAREWVESELDFNKMVSVHCTALR